MTAKMKVICIDALTPNILYPLMNQLPTLKKIFWRGVSGILQSPTPITPAAMMTVYTGRDDHGVKGFADFPNLKGAKENGSKYLWDYMECKVGLVNLPMTYPAFEVNGYMVSGFPLPEEPEQIWYYPATLNLEPFVVKIADLQTYSALVKAEEKAVDLMVRLEGEIETDFQFYYLELLDRVGHHFWGLPEHVDAYNRIDGYLERLITFEEDAVLVFSDHGMNAIGNDKCKVYRDLLVEGSDLSELRGGHQVDGVYSFFGDSLPTVANAKTKGILSVSLSILKWYGIPWRGESLWP